MEAFHIGNIISQRLKEEGRTKVWLASKVCCDQSNLCKILSKTHLDTDILKQISLALNHNFFKYYDVYFNSEQEQVN